MMKSSLLSVCRLINTMNPTMTIPQTSVVAVNIDRASLEEIRKRKGISIRTLERKINLSKSRYYRWLHYETDLPLELVMGLKKILNLSDRELLNLFVSSTDEQIQMLALVIYSSLSTQSEDIKRFLNLRKILTKFQCSTEDNIAFQLILTYSDLVFYCQDKQAFLKSLTYIAKYFTTIDYFTIFDLLLYLATLRITLNLSYPNQVMERECIILENSLLKKLCANCSNEWKGVLIGCVIDLSLCFFDTHDCQRAIQLLNKASVILQDHHAENRQIKEVFQCLACHYLTKEHVDDRQLFQAMDEHMMDLIVDLPPNENRFFSNLYSQEEHAVE